MENVSGCFWKGAVHMFSLLTLCRGHRYLAMSAFGTPQACFGTPLNR